MSSLPDGLAAVCGRRTRRLRRRCSTRTRWRLGFRSRLGEEDVVDMWAHTDLEHDSWLLEEDGRIAAAGGGQLHAGTYFVRGCVRPGAKGRGLGSVLLDISEGRARAHGVATLHQVALGPDHGRATALLRVARLPRGAASLRDGDRARRMNRRSRAIPADFSIETFREEDAEPWYAAMSEIFAGRVGLRAGAVRRVVATARG